MPHPSWNENYAAGQMPWDTGQPEPLLVEFVTSDRIRPARTLEIGAGTGTNSIWLAERGFDVLGIDVAPLAIERATAKLDGRDLCCRFQTLDILAGSLSSDPAPGGPFHFVFDRGCFHIFDEPEERARFAGQVAAALAPGWPMAELDRLDRGRAARDRSAAPLCPRGHARHRTRSRDC